MGLPCFAKVLKCGCLAIFGLAAAFAAIAVLSTPTAAHNHGGGGDVSLKSWDTDNLRYGSYSARSFNIPFHQYGGYSETACQSGVADAFFQAGGSVGAVNDFPYLEWVSSGDSGSWVEAEGGTRSDGCDEFVEQQDEMVSQIVGNGGYYLDLSGKLQKLGSIPSRFSGRLLVYGDWDEKGPGFAVNFGTGEVSRSVEESGYLSRVDGYSSSRAMYPYNARWTVPERTGNGNFGSSWHGRLNGSNVKVARPVGGVVSGGYLPAGGDLCPARFHPRGEDSADRIGRSTGRTLTGLKHAEAMTADMYWCRSDLRFGRRFHPEIHSGVSKHPEAATKEFTAYGRLNCYYTAFPITAHGSATEGIHQDTSGGMVCSYLFPVPQCDIDTDNNSDEDWRDYTAEELEDIADDLGTGKFNKNEGQPCPEAMPGDTELVDSTPRNPSDFSSTACVTATLSIYENRTVGSDAEPGIVSDDRTLAVASNRTAWDMDITSPHPFTASPPKRNGDNSGCADGSEDRAYHSASAGHSRRKQTPTPSYSASGRTNTSAPPNDLDDDIDYSGAAKNMAHRYASKIAENTCAAKRAEAGLRIALLEAEAELYKDWMGRYKDWAKSKKDAFDVWRPSGYPSGTNPDTSTSLSVHPTFYSYKHAKRSQSRIDYASAMSAMYAARETAASNVVSTSLVKPTVASSWCGDPDALVESYSTSVAGLKTASDNAIAAGTEPSRPSEGPISSASPNAGSVGVVNTNALTEGSARVPAVWGGLYSYSYTDNKGKKKTVNLSACYQTAPVFPSPDIFTYRGGCIYAQAVPEVKASGTSSSVTYSSYTFTLSGGGWSKTVTVPQTQSTALCSSWRTSSCYANPSSHPAHWGYVSYWNGALLSVTDFPSATGAPVKSVGSPLLSLLLGKYYPQHTSRTNLKNPTAQTRNQAATDLGELKTSPDGTITPTAFSNIAVPSGNPATNSVETTQRSNVKTAAETYQNTYTKAYDDAYTQATGHMSGTTWNSFDWRYETSTLAWGGYEEDPASTYSASTATPRDGTGCDLVNVAADGAVSVEATRLDYETSSYGKGSVYDWLTASQRECKTESVLSY